MTLFLILIDAQRLANVERVLTDVALLKCKFSFKARFSLHFLKCFVLEYQDTYSYLYFLLLKKTSKTNNTNTLAYRDGFSTPCFKVLHKILANILKSQLTKFKLNFSLVYVFITEIDQIFYLCDSYSLLSIFGMR